MSAFQRGKSGIYRITFKSCNAVYIGQSVYIAKRRSGHFGDLRKGKHGNRYMQIAFDKHGSDSFVFEPFISLIELDGATLTELEQGAIDLHRECGSFEVLNIVRAALSPAASVSVSAPLGIDDAAYYASMSPSRLRSLVSTGRLWDIDAVAHYISQPQKTIRRLVSKGEFPEPVTLLNGLPSWLRRDVDKWIESLRQVAVAERASRSTSSDSFVSHSTFSLS
ncbi:GIY-YIG nuclease family protein [Paraburkholderia aspalathi]|uniref:GIY-YIG nuclease family protein n=1 Tax=Paraburkholderia nemoris TaxID=2793076 RepID=UPI00190B0783|nr:GIY-YIG nuclease family protein [Paraburkholderia nemoris]MBK3743357.1 GIY-YIG nuclease family protein [Paraburkholderia aspalathi]